MAFRILIMLLLSISFMACKDDDPQEPSGNSGDINFIKTLGGSLNDSGQSIISTTDGGYAILGFTQSMDGDITDKSSEDFDYLVLKYSATDELQWTKTYGGTGDDRGRSVIQTADGGYAILGTSTSNDMDVSGNAGFQDYWLAKLDASGSIQWQKSYGFQGNDNGISVIQTNDSGYLITGVLDVTASGGAGNTSSRSSARHAGGDYWAVKLDTSGDLQWSQYYGGNFTDTPEGVIQLDDGSYIIAGGSDSEDTDISSNIGTYDFWIIRISSTGSLIWEKSFGGSEIDEARAIVPSGDGNFIVAGDTRSNSNNVSNNNGGADLWLIKVSPQGNLLWENTIGGTNFDVARAIYRTQDNGFLLAGSSRSSDGDVAENKGQNDAWVVKVNSNGELQWETSIGGSNIDFAYGVTELSDGSIMAVGDTTSNDRDIQENKGFTDLLLIKLDN